MFLDNSRSISLLLVLIFGGGAFLFTLRKWLRAKKQLPAHDAVLSTYQAIVQTPSPFNLQDVQRWRLHRGYLQLIVYPVILLAFVFSYSHVTLTSRPLAEVTIDITLFVATLFFMMKYRHYLHAELENISLIPAVVAHVSKTHQGQNIRHKVTVFFQKNGADHSLELFGSPPPHLKNLDHVVLVADLSRPGLKAIGYVRVNSMNSLRSPYVSCRQARKLSLLFTRAK